MLSRLLQIIVVLIPLGMFTAVLPPVQKEFYGGGEVWRGIAYLLVALTVLAVAEGLLFRYWILPSWGRALSERLYAGSYLPENDALAQFVQRVETTRNAALLPELEKLVQQQPRRARGWLELARLQQELAKAPARACESLQTGAAAMRDREDAALLLYRAASVARKAMQDTALADILLHRLAAEYSATVYGRKAAALLPEQESKD